MYSKRKHNQVIRSELDFTKFIVEVDQTEILSIFQICSQTISSKPFKAIESKKPTSRNLKKTHVENESTIDMVEIWELNDLENEVFVTGEPKENFYVGSEEFTQEGKKI